MDYSIKVTINQNQENIFINSAFNIGPMVGMEKKGIKFLKKFWKKSKNGLDEVAALDCEI